MSEGTKIEVLEFPGFDAIEITKPVSVDRERYVRECQARWFGGAYRNAIANWARWELNHELLLRAMMLYREDTVSLRDFLWRLQDEVNPDRRRLDPFLDFEEYFQKVFLARGLVFYCVQILEGLESRDGARERGMRTRTAERSETGDRMGTNDEVRPEVAG